MNLINNKENSILNGILYNSVNTKANAKVNAGAITSSNSSHSHSLPLDSDAAVLPKSYDHTIANTTTTTTHPTITKSIYSDAISGVYDYNRSEIKEIKKSIEDLFDYLKYKGISLDKEEFSDFIKSKETAEKLAELNK